MGKRIPLSPDEKAYIWEWAHKKTWGQIAKELGEQFSCHNGGHRCWQTVKHHVWRKRQPAKVIESYPVPIRVDVLHMARAKGFTKNDLSDLLEIYLIQL